MRLTKSDSKSDLNTVLLSAAIVTHSYLITVLPRSLLFLAIFLDCAN